MPAWLVVLMLTVLVGCAADRRGIAFERDLDRCTLLHVPGQEEHWREERAALFSDGYFLGEPGAMCGAA